MKKKSNFTAFFGFTVLIAVIALVIAACGTPAEPNPCENGHSFTEFVSTTATCITAGQDTHKCERCTETNQSARAALGHNIVWVDDYTSIDQNKCDRTGCTHIAGVGDTGPGGGTIYYVSSDGFEVVGYGTDETVTGYFETYIAHYIEVAPATPAIPSQPWGLSPNNTNTLIENGLANYTTNSTTLDLNGINEVIGKGRKDTQIIIAALGTSAEYAARSASAYTTASGHNDWFLPSITEFHILHQSTVSMPYNTSFWTSAQAGVSQAWEINLYSGNVTVSNKAPFSLSFMSVRAIRAF